MCKKPKIHFVLGPTCSGKSGLAIKIAQDFQKQTLSGLSQGVRGSFQENFQNVTSSNFDQQNSAWITQIRLKTVIINCDSRQVYKQNHIGSCLVEGVYKKMSPELKLLWNDLCANAEECVINKNYSNLGCKPFENRPKQDQTNQDRVELEKNQYKNYAGTVSEDYLSESGLSKSKIYESDNSKDPTELIFAKKTKESFWQIARNSESFFESEGVIHFLVDFLDLDQDYNLLKFVQDFCFLYQVLSDLGCENIILTGGTVLYAKAVLEKYQLTVPKPGQEQTIKQIEKTVDSLSKVEMQTKLEGLKPNHNLNNSEYNNPQRLKRHLIKILAKDYQTFWKYNFEKDDFGQIIILNPDFENIQNKVWQRIDFWLENGLLINEVLQIKKVFGAQKVSQLGLSYLPCLDFLEYFQIQNFDQIVEFYEAKYPDKNGWIDALKKQKGGESMKKQGLENWEDCESQRGRETAEKYKNFSKSNSKNNSTQNNSKAMFTAKDYLRMEIFRKNRDYFEYQKKFYEQLLFVV